MITRNTGVLLPGDPGYGSAARKRPMRKQRRSSAYVCADCGAERQVRFLNPDKHDLYAGDPLGCPTCGSEVNPVPEDEPLAASARVAALLRKMPNDVRLLLAPDEDTATARHRYLRAHGLSDEQIRRGLVEMVHRSRSSSVAAPVTAAGGTGHGSVTAARPPVPAARLTARDRERMLGNVAAARAAGHDPDRFYPGWRDRLLASGGPDRPIPALVPPVRASSGASTGSTTSGPNRPASRATRRRAW